MQGGEISFSRTIKGRTRDRMHRSGGIFRVNEAWDRKLRNRELLEDDYGDGQRNKYFDDVRRNVERQIDGWQRLMIPRNETGTGVDVSNVSIIVTKFYISVAYL